MDDSGPYLSHPVRRLREDPIQDETVELLVDVDAEDSDEPAVDDVAAALDEIGTVEERLRFASLRVTVAQTAIDEVCAVDGIAAIETANTLAMDPDDAGEDVRPDED